MDDIKLSDSQCPQPVNCDFNTDWCGWTYNYDEKEKIFWEVGYGRVDNPKQLKVKNLITDNSNDKLLYTDFTTYQNNTFIAKDIYSDVIQSGTSFDGSCLQFMLLPRTITDDQRLQVFIINMDNHIIQSLWNSKFMVSNNHWIKIIVDVNYHKSFRFLFRLETQISSTYILIDNITYKKGSCDSQIEFTTPKTTTSFPTDQPLNNFDCDFEKNMCNWKIDKKHSQFQMNNHEISNMYVPKFDHTKNNINGTFVYLINTNPASIIGSIYTNDQLSSYHGPICVKFWYYIQTESWETNFNLTLNQNDNPIKQFHQADDHGKKWNLGMIQFEIEQNNNFSYQLMINAQVKLGIIAFDDFKMNYSYCSTGQHTKECYFEGGDCQLHPLLPVAKPNWKTIKGHVIYILFNNI